MTLRDYFSLIAVVISIISLSITLFQKTKENKRTVRKNLSDTLESISKIGIESSKLRREVGNDNSEPIVNLRRNYNTQRAILIAHADYLAKSYNNLTTDIDCRILAEALKSIGDLEKAESYWEKTIEKSESNSMKHLNLRGYAEFLFVKGQIALGRKTYDEALLLDLPDDDHHRRILTDTYILWAAVENSHNNNSESRRIIGRAQDCCSRIGNKEMRLEMEQRIKNLQPTVEENKTFA